MRKFLRRGDLPHDPDIKTDRQVPFEPAAPVLQQQPLPDLATVAGFLGMHQETDTHIGIEHLLPTGGERTSQQPGGGWHRELVVAHRISAPPGGFG